MNNLLLLPSARLIPAELRADFGPIPSGMIPLNSKPALHHIIERHASECPRVVIGVNESAHLVRSYVLSRPELRAQCVDVGSTSSLGETVARVLRAQSLPDSLTINFADTLVEDVVCGSDVLLYQELENVYRWTTFELNDTKEIRGIVEKEQAKSKTGRLPVFVGVFRFSRAAQFLAVLEQYLDECEPGVDPFYSAVIEYFNSIPRAGKQIVPVEGWKDLGHLDTYYSVKQQLFLNSRAFNFLDLDLRRGVIRKSSSNATKLRNEIQWYITLPKSLQYLIPRVFDYSLDGNNTFAELEFYGYPALADVYLHGDWDLGVWSQVLDGIGSALDGMAAHGASDIAPDACKRAMTEMYIQKTRDRLQSSLESKAFEAFTRDSVTINGRECMGAMRCLSAVPEVAKALGLLEPRKFTIIHGDLCLSNILYDRRSGFVRLIDPRGTFGDIFLYGDPRYELAKLSHSLEGDYDFLVNGLFEIVICGPDIRMEVAHRRSHRNIKRMFHAWLLRRAGECYWPIKFIESLLFFSMVPLHEDRPKAQRGFLARAIETFQDVLDEIDQQNVEGVPDNGTIYARDHHYHGR